MTAVASRHRRCGACLRGRRPRSNARAASRAATRKASGLGDEDGRVGGRAASRARRAPDRLAAVPKRPPRPNASACAAPHRPMRSPSRGSRPCAGEAHHRRRSRRRRRRRWQRRARTPRRAAARAAPTRPVAARPGKRRRRGEAAADRPEPHDAEPRTADRRCRRPRRASMPASTPPCCKPGELGGGARRQAEHQPGERLEDQFLGAVGEHRDEHEDREPPRLRLGPDFRQALREAPSRGAATAICERHGRCRRPSMLHTARTAISERDDRDDGQRPRPGESAKTDRAAARRSAR